MGNNVASTAAGKRIEALLDYKSFVEIGSQVTARNTDFNLGDNKAAGDGVICGYGLIEGNLVYVYSQDSTVLGGSVGEMHARKICSLYDMAMKVGAPVIALIDSAGFRLQESCDALEAAGAIYRKQVVASGVIPQISAVFGNCGGGMALIPGLSDFTFMENNAKYFVSAPNTVDGNNAAKCDTASAEFKSAKSGVIDAVGTEEEIIEMIRNTVAVLPENNEDNQSYSDCEDDLNRAVEGARAYASDPVALLGQISDNGLVVEKSGDYMKEMVTALIKLNGITVGVVANRTEILGEDGKAVEKFDARITAGGAKKAAEFVTFCDAFNIPVVTFTNVVGYATDKHSEIRMAGAVSSLVGAFAGATVPKINVITGKAYGSAYVAMNSKGIGADFVYAWDGSEVGTMDAAMAAKVLCPDADADTLKAKTEEYKNLQNNVNMAAARGYVDTVIAPEDTRKYLIGTIEMLFTKREDRPYKKHNSVL